MNFEMDIDVLARIFHIVGVIFWIGGVAFVTTILFPVIKKIKKQDEQVEFFEKIESGFAFQSKISTLITGISGFFLLYRWDAWERYTNISYWWIHAMTITWIVYTLILFVFEPYFLHKWYIEQSKINPIKTFKMMHCLHWILLSLSILTIFGTISGSHGWFLF